MPRFETISLSGMPKEPEQPIKTVEAFILSRVLPNLPERKLLLNLAETGKSPSFRIGNERWRIRVIKDKNTTENDRLFLLMQTIRPDKNQEFTRGIVTDSNITAITGLIYGRPNHEIIFTTEAFDFYVTSLMFRDQAFQKVIQSLHRTHSPLETSKIAGVRKDRVASIAKKTA